MGSVFVLQFLLMHFNFSFPDVLEHDPDDESRRFAADLLLTLQSLIIDKKVQLIKSCVLM